MLKLNSNTNEKKLIINRLKQILFAGSFAKSINFKLSAQIFWITLSCTKAWVSGMPKRSPIPSSN